MQYVKNKKTKNKSAHRIKNWRRGKIAPVYRQTTAPARHTKKLSSEDSALLFSTACEWRDPLVEINRPKKKTKESPRRKEEKKNAEKQIQSTKAALYTQFKDRLLRNAIVQ